MAEYPEIRKLDGIFLRVQVDGHLDARCLTDIPWEEIEAKWRDRDAEWWRGAAKHLHERLRSIGDQFDILGFDPADPQD